MASTWGDSWSVTWASSWDIAAPVVVSGGGGGGVGIAGMAPNRLPKHWELDVDAGDEEEELMLIGAALYTWID